ncbi:MAG: hypothetical protein WAL47_05510 [Pyrinomonadaceae bacterium]|jgi:hypothetical protein
MKFKPITRLVLVLVPALLLLLLLEGTGLAQCAMCRASLAGSNNAFFIRNFNIGVLVLLTPPVAIFCSIFIILKRHSGAGEQQDRDEGR